MPNLGRVGRRVQARARLRADNGGGDSGAGPTGAGSGTQSLAVSRGPRWGCRWFCSAVALLAGAQATGAWNRGLSPERSSKPRRARGRGGSASVLDMFFSFAGRMAPFLPFSSLFLGHSDVLPGYAIIAPWGTLCQVPLFEHLSSSDEKERPQLLGIDPRSH